MVKDVVAVPMQSVTIRTGDSNLSPEEIEKKKQKVAAARQRRQQRRVRRTSRRKSRRRKKSARNSQKVVFLKNGGKAKMVKVTTGISDDTYMEIKSGVQPGDEVISGSYSAISRKLKDGAKVTHGQGREVKSESWTSRLLEVSDSDDTRI